MRPTTFRLSLCTQIILFASLSPAATTAPSPTTVPARTPDSAITPVPRIPKAHAAIMKNVAAGNIDVVMLGDSITSRWPKFGPESWKTLIKYNVIDEGVSGDCTENVLWRINNGELDGINPKALVLLISINNLWHHPDEKPEWAAAGVAKIVATVHEKLPNTKVVLLAVFPVGPIVPARDRVQIVNTLISKLDDGDKTRYLDIGKNFLNPGGEVNTTLLADGVHPNAAGYDVWLKAIDPVLQELTK